VVAAENPVAVYFGKNLLACRKRAGISQEELGLCASLHRTEVGLLERGARVPRIDTLIKLASALSMPPAELLDGIDWKPHSVQRGGFEFRPPGEAGTP
jgi:transcriptional regulator with XRE-family HTH domain